MRKKITLIALAAAALLSGCDKSSTVQVDNGYAVQVEVSDEVDLYELFSNGDRYDVFVCLYEQSVANDFDFVESVSSMRSKREMTVNDGLASKTVSPSYVSGSRDMGTHTIGDVKEGDYTIVACGAIIFNHDSYVDTVFGSYAYKKIVVPGNAGVHKLALREWHFFEEYY
jgi:ABC-type enterochelin transport system substrate-binding protein